ncbi:plasmid replication protein, CyRepA1 family [Merismopedia glauca]|uniref:plasmid replication protein, CyRepA1 family n=1 Tax=Merismopedia glauca TaxID=292586 RepID=UPI001FE47D0D|nr:plasmid replication protein, CyRepA1 family [Merismopedia glauca]
MLTTNTVPASASRGFGTANPGKPVEEADFSSKDQLSLRRACGVSPCIGAAMPKALGETCSLPIRYSLEPDHFLEWTQGSGVDPGIVRLNVETLLDSATDPNADCLFPIAERLNWQVRRFGHKARGNLRGWWVSGLDPLNNWQRMEWGRFKPDTNTPIIDKTKGKPAKYLSPSGSSSRLVLLDVPGYIWQKISERYDVPVTTLDLALGFWHWVCLHQLPVILTEGEKKAGCLLTLGYCAIALPGIFNGYRKESGLIPELQVFATPERQFHICFDFETKPKTIQNINIAIAKLGKLLVNQGAKVSVINLPGLEKGVDDFLLAHGADAFGYLYQSAQDLDSWQAQKLWALTYTPTITLNQRYLGKLPFPKSGLACIKSPKGSGKTQSLEPLIQEATRVGRKVIILTHRVQLGRALCDRLGLDWVEDIRESETNGLLGFGLCVDSLHFHSQARFNPQQWHGAILIIDEAEQVLWHALNSYTCHEDRVPILDNLRELVQLIVSTDGLIIAQDADLSDVSVNYLRSLAQETDDFPQMAQLPLEPWVVINEWQDFQVKSQKSKVKSEEGVSNSSLLPITSYLLPITSQSPTPTPAFFYDTSKPDALLTRIDNLLTQGAVFVALDAQKVKGKYSSINLESLFQQKHPHLRILRIDSQSVSDPNHPAYGSIENLNEILPNYDLVLATPTIGTGVDIHLKGHFIAVVGIFQGVIPDAEARQALARVREPVPRYIWAASFGSAKIGNGSCNYREIIHSKKKDVKWNINRLLEQDFDIDGGHDPITLRTWAKMAARVNVSLWHYRQELKHGLVREGHEITVVTEDVGQIVPASVIDAIAQEVWNYLSQLLAIWQLFPPIIYYLLPITFSSVMAAMREDLRSGLCEFPGFEYLHKDHDIVAIATNAIELTQVRDLNKQTEAIAVVNAPDLTPSEYQKLQNQRVKTTDERLSERKHQLQQRYPIPITPEIKIRDDDGWYPKLRLHYYLTYDPQIVRDRDLKEWNGHLERGNGKVFLPDVKLLTAQVELLRGLGIPALLDPIREVRATDADVQRLAQICRHCSRDVKDIFNFTASEKTTPIQIVQALLDKLGLKLTQVGRDTLPNGKRAGILVYQYVPNDDGREEIFGLWELQRGQVDQPLDI